MFITAHLETPKAVSSQGMFPLLPGGQAKQSHSLPEPRREHYVNHKALLHLKKLGAATFKGQKRPRAREIGWSPFSRYGLRTDVYDEWCMEMLIC